MIVHERVRDIVSVPGANRFKTADDLRIGMVVLERSDRGTIKVRAKVTDVGVCSDSGNVHVHVQFLSLRGEATWCYFRNTPVEVMA
jgi:hypothetical protein